MSDVDLRTKAQFEIRHVLGLMAGSGALFAIVAPQLRKLEADDQFSVLLQAIIVAAVIFVIMAVLLYKRRRAEIAAGPITERLEPSRSRWWFWLITGGLLVAYIVSIASHLDTAARTNVPVVIFGNPVLLFLLVNFVVVRGWWHIDPVAIEVCEHGLILGGFRFLRWDDIQRYSWTGEPNRQLNLFCKSRHVLNFGIEPKLAKRLEPILRGRVV